MSVPFKIAQGNLTPSLKRTLTDQNGSPKDLTGHTATITWRREGDAASTTKSVFILVPETDGNVQYDWVSGDTDVDGLYNYVIKSTDGSLPGTHPTVEYGQFLIWNDLTEIGQYAITWPDVVNFDSVLANVDPGAHLRILEHVNTTLKVSEFGGEDCPKLRLARIYLAAHYGTLTMRGGSKAGPLVSQTVGPISRSYAQVMAVGGSLFTTTSWGQAYLQLVRNSPARLPCVI